MVVGTFLIINMFSILVAQRSRELALLRATRRLASTGEHLRAPRRPSSSGLVGFYSRHRSRVCARHRSQGALQRHRARPRCRRACRFAMRTVVVSYVVEVSRSPMAGRLSTGPIAPGGSCSIAGGCAMTSSIPESSLCRRLLVRWHRWWLAGIGPDDRRGPARRWAGPGFCCRSSAAGCWWIRIGVSLTSTLIGADPSWSGSASSTAACSGPSASSPPRTRCETRAAPPPRRARS